MPLTLEVVGQKAAQMGGSVRKVFQASGTIGRLRDNDWVLPDEYISGHHAKITFINGTFLLEDTSTNGVFINSLQNRMIRGQPYALRHGDTVYIDDYEVRVTLGAEPFAAASYAPSGSYARPNQQASLIPEDPFLGDLAGNSSTPNEADPLSLLGFKEARVVPPGPSAASLAGGSPLSQHYRPPCASVLPAPPLDNNVAPEDYDPFADEPRTPARNPSRLSPAPANNSVIPDDYDPFADNTPSPMRDPPRQSAPPPITAEPSPRRPPPRSSATVVTSPPRVPRPGARAAAIDSRGGAPAAGIPGNSARSSGQPRNPEPTVSTVPVASANVPAASGGLDFAALLAAAGIDSSHETAELAAQFGQILRVVVSGLMDVLRARERIKDEFRMRMTTFKQADNNPLKFSVNVEDALHNLLVKRNAAYLGPVEAFEDAFQDLRNHQMAMLAGMRVAYDAMLAEFDPGHLQDEFDRHLKSGSFLSGPAKLKYWDLYRNRFHDMVKDADSSFRNLFGDEFAKAYEEQLIRLRTLNRAERR